MRRVIAIGLVLLAATRAFAGSVPEESPAATPAETATPVETAAPEATPLPDATATPEVPPAPSPDATPAPAASPAPTPFDDTELEMRRPKNANIAAALGLLFPGAGHLYLGEPGRGAIFLGAEVGELTSAAIVISSSGWDPEDETDTRYQRALLPLAWLQNTHILGAYDAWRQARLRAPEAYEIIPQPSTPKLLLAPFAFRQLARPQVGIPLAIVFGVGIGVGSQAEGGEAKFTELDRIPIFGRDYDKWAALGLGMSYYTGTFYAVGIGEEAIFRGLLQTIAEENLGPRWGWLVATAIFASLHYANGATTGEGLTAVAATSLVGGYLGWVYQRDGHDLTAPVFMHTWYDVGIGLTVFLLDPEHQPFTAGFSIPF